MSKSLIQLIFPKIAAEPAVEKSTHDIIRDIDRLIANEEAVWSQLTDPLLIDSSILKIESLKKKRQSLHYEAVAQHKKRVG